VRNGQTISAETAQEDGRTTSVDNSRTTNVGTPPDEELAEEEDDAQSREAAHDSGARFRGRGGRRGRGPDALGARRA
jgi:hypothetical protein